LPFKELPFKELPLTLAVRPARSGERGVLLDLQILLGKTQEIAAASVSGELGKTFVLGGKPSGNPIFVAVTPRIRARRPVPPRPIRWVTRSKG
jgi:hypothetical protein